MKEIIACGFCGEGRCATIDTYKHRWAVCRRCGNAFRRRRDRYLLSRVLPHRVAGWLPSRLRDRLLSVPEVVEREETFYDYYESASAGVEARTKWRDESETILRRLRTLGMEARGKTILDVSGGPGFFARHLAEVAARVVVTEFSERAVQGMIRNLGLEVRRFDYNSDRLEQVVPWMFDLVFIRYSINFSKDIKAFAASLRRIVRAGALVYVSFVPPTLGCCVRWQYDEYTYNALYSSRSVVEAFRSEGLDLLHSWSDGTYHYGSNRHLLYTLCDFLLPYAMLARRQARHIDPAMVQRNVAQVYRASRG